MGGMMEDSPQRVMRDAAEESELNLKGTGLTQGVTW
jgi:hypothetical protein